VESCGVFVCAFNALRKLKLDQEVNVYAPVLLAHNRRRQFLKTSVSQLQDPNNAAFLRAEQIQFALTARGQNNSVFWSIEHWLSI